LQQSWYWQFALTLLVLTLPGRRFYLKGFPALARLAPDMNSLVVDAFNLYLHDQWRDLTTLRQIPVEKIFVYHIDDADNLPLA
ncbi:hypothetical protein MJN51_41565, partial [Salmonella enterica subsp. enterica serovar Kentucky]|nr:hypothetical protein [Salmonella enterica subsp. enterica serovar Kentucky]